jgi:hypothetical protein
MNLIEQAERLKTLPDQELVQMQQRPTMIAPFLVLAEMQRRETMRKAATSGQDPVQQTTVAQEMSSRLAQMQPQQQPQQTQQMRTGGAVRAANGLPDDVSKFFDYTGEASIPAPPAAGMTRAPGLSRITSPMPAFDLSEIEALAGPARGTGAILSEIRGVRGESPLVALGEQLKQREEQVRGQRQSLGETLMRLGLGMAASRRPDFLGAVGEGGLSALQGYVQNRDFTRKEAADLLRQRMAVEAQRQQSDDVLFREAGELARSEQYGRVSTIQAIQAARNTALTANTAAEREEARNRANALVAQFNADQKRAEEARQREFQAGESQKERESSKEIARIRAGGTGRGGGIGLDDQVKLMNSTISQNNSMLDSLYKRLLTVPADKQEAIRKNIAELETRGRQLGSASAMLLSQVGVPIPRISYEDQPPPPQTEQPKPQGTGAGVTQGPTSLQRLTSALQNATPAETSALSAMNPAVAAILNLGRIKSQIGKINPPEN